MSQTRRYWFPAKRYGWGWAPPVTWQGWVTVMVWFGVLIVGAIRLLPAHPAAFAVFTALLCVLLTFVCYITGEPPRWRGKE